MNNNTKGPIGIFDSGYGGLTVFKKIAGRLPEYDYIYLGDNARVPYGTRSFETVYQYTRECVEHLFELGCRLVILACNTASAKALRTIQQQDLPRREELRRVLGVIRPSAEEVGKYSLSGHIGILATSGTVNSLSYPIEIEKFYPGMTVFQQDCPMWVPLVENNEHEQPGADYFIKKQLDRLMRQSKNIDVIVLGCTHYPLLINKIRRYLPSDVKLFSQGPVVAEKLEDYLFRHPEINKLCSVNGTIRFYTTESPADFDRQAAIFFDKQVKSLHFQL